MISKKKISLGLLFIFFLGFALRFLYFPENTYFGFDQARDVFASLEIMKGDLKIVGPPTANGVLHHGVLYYYIFAPIYFLSGGDPAAVSAFLRIVNASGVFILFLSVYPMFGMVTAFFASFLFAVSFEQTQFALFLNHPSLAVISVLIFYLGLSYWIFRKKDWGLFLALFGLGLSIQFEFVEVQLIAVFVLFLIAFRKNLPKLTLKNISFAFIAFFLPVSTYIISEIKNNFITIRQIPEVFSQVSPMVRSQPIFLTILNRYFHDNFIANPIAASALGLIFLIILIKLILKKDYKNQLIFLGLWFFGGFLVYFFINNDAYFYNTGTSISLLIFAAFLISRIYTKNKLLAFSLIILIFISNIYLITKNNPLGPNQKINPQIGLLLKDQKKILDFIYQSADGKEFAVNALTSPLYVNTTWSYLFEWYGRKKYGYVPVWGGDGAEGFPGNLRVETARSQLPEERFLIIEPLEGIPLYLVDSFLQNEENFNMTLEKKYIGTMQVWVQKPR